MCLKGPHKTHCLSDLLEIWGFQFFAFNLFKLCGWKVYYIGVITRQIYWHPGIFAFLVKEILIYIPNHKVNPKSNIMGVISYLSPSSANLRFRVKLIFGVKHCICAKLRFCAI